jgi:hypothetical protein
MLHRTSTLLIAVLSVTLGSATHLAAQIRASERGTVSQIVDGTTITVDYGRPQARGRSNLFGGVVHWGKVWTPGANWATTLRVDRDVTIEGQSLPTGTYSVWLEVLEGTWNAVLDPEPRRFHLMPPEESADQVRFSVQPIIGDRDVEVLTWSFPRVKSTGTTLQLAWGTTVVTFEIQVQPSRPMTVAEEVAARHVGGYRLRHRPPLGEEGVRFDIRYQDEHLVASWESPPNPLFAEVWLISLGEGMFVPALLEDGEIFDLVMDLVFEFTPLEGRSRGFEVRALGDELWGTATRADTP